MGQAADYRKHAEECRQIAQTARTAAQRTMLLHIAETWMRLANDAETMANGHANGATSLN
jgi:hypothetical protein